MVRTRLNIGCRYSTPVLERPLHPTRSQFKPQPSQTQAPVTPATEPERRAGGGLTTPVPGMSTGTADQLYLALRVASVTDYLDRASPLPFVADDLFINFDDERAAAGFRVLGHLGTATQVLFFTHHEHLVAIARATLGATVPVVSLE